MEDKLLKEKIEPNKGEKNLTGVYWGTFDPPTIAHGEIIKQSLGELELSNLVIVVNDNKTTGKDYNMPGKNRRETVRQTIESLVPAQDRKRISVLIQKDDAPISYETVKKAHPKNKIVAILRIKNLTKNF